MTSDDLVRAFIAVEVDDATRAACAAFQAAARRTGAVVRWVDPGVMHLTLIFFGDIFAGQVPAVCAAMDAVAQAHGPFELEVRGTGCFGNPRAPRVVWAGIRGGAERLLALHGDLAGAMRALGHRVEERPLVPHLTLGRVKSTRCADRLADLIAARRQDAFGDFAVRRLALKKSTLTPQGFRYTSLHAADLGASIVSPQGEGRSSRTPVEDDRVRWLAHLSATLCGRGDEKVSQARAASGAKPPDRTEV